jgi:hypothetical protein
MNTNSNITENHGIVLGQIGWKYYNTIKKKAMEQEFSWAGLFLSLSIAFFIVIASALMLSIFYQSLQLKSLETGNNSNFYRLEVSGINTAQYHGITENNCQVA